MFGKEFLRFKLFVFGIRFVFMNVYQKVSVVFASVILFPGFLGANLLGLESFFERLGFSVPGVVILFFGIFGGLVSLGGFLWVALRMWKEA